MIYSQNREVSASLCGTEAKLSVVGILAIVEDSITELMAELEIDGVTAIKKYNAIIVYTKNHIKILRSAPWRKKMVVTSFVSSKKLASFCIDTCICGENEDIIAYSRIELCGIDMQTKRLRKITTIGVDDTIQTVAPMCEICFNPKMEHNPTRTGSVQVQTSNIDYVHHTNNIEYIKFLLNTLSVDEIERCPISEMEIIYANQSFEGDVLDICQEKSPDGLYYEIRKGETTVLKCEMTLCPPPKK